MLLRRAEPDDAVEVARVYVESWNIAFVGRLPPRTLDTVQVESWERDLRAQASVWRVIDAGGRLAGFVGTGPSRDPEESGLGELDTIAVDPQHWRQGLGRRLMEVALDDLATAGYSDAILWTLGDYEGGREFYESTGWRATGEERDAGLQIAFRRRPLGPRE